jgi:hypothetical protein
MLVLAELTSIVTKKKVVFHFVERYVSRLYGVQAIQAWANKNKGWHLFQMFIMSDVAYTLAVIENRYAAWDKIHEKSAQQGQDEDSTRDGDRNTRTVKGKYTSHSGSKRQYNHLGWSQDGMDFYDWVKMGWKKLSSKNVNDVWTELEDEWMSFMEEIKYGNWKARDVIESGGPQAEEMMTLPLLPLLVLEGDEDFEDDRPAWKKRTRLNPEDHDHDSDHTYTDNEEEEEKDELWYSVAN